MRRRIFTVTVAVGLLGATLLFAGSPAPVVAAIGPRPTASPPATGAPTHARATASPTAHPYTAVPSSTPLPIVYSDPALATVSGVWLGELSRAANVRRGPGLIFASSRAWPRGRRVLVYATALAANGERWYQVGHYPDPDLYVHSSVVSVVAPLAGSRPLHPGRWVDVNLTQQTVTAYEGSRPVLLGQTSSGKPGHETLAGSWQIYWRLPLQDMQGGGETPTTPVYNLKDVPWIQYFQMTGQGLHGAYWHDNFGRPMSHGCVNLTIPTANWLYVWAGLGTPVEVHY